MISLLTGDSVSFLMTNCRAQEGSLSFSPGVINISNQIILVAVGK